MKKELVLIAQSLIVYQATEAKQLDMCQLNTLCFH